MTIAPASEDRSALGRAMTILDCWDGDGDILTLTEIVARSGLPKSTVYRTLSQMAEHELVQRLSVGYCLGVKIVLLGQRTPVFHEMRELATPLLADLYELTRENVRLSIRHGLDIVQLLLISGSRSSKFQSSGGVMRNSAHCTATGKAILAFSPAEDVEGVIQSGMTPRTTNTITDADAFRHELAQIRSRGFAVNNQENSPGVISIAAPVLDAAGQALAAISVTTKHHHLAEASVGRRVLAAAAAVSSAWIRRRG